jgi:predicted lipopolysaccharide heptosyltransferase III
MTGGEPQRILILAIRALGDVVLTTPVYRNLRLAYPAARLEVLVEEPYEALLRHNPCLDRLWTVDRSRTRSAWQRWREQVALVWALRRERFDVVLDLFGGPRSAILARLSGAPRRIGPVTRGHGWLYTERLSVPKEGLHLVRQKLAMAGPLLPRAEELPLELVVTAEERAWARARLAQAGVTSGSPLVGFFPGAGWWHKTWPPERFAALGDALQRDLGAAILVLGGTRDVASTHAVAGRMQRAPVVMDGLADLRETMALIDAVHLFVSNDTGPMHIAMGLGKPTLVLFGPSDPRKYGPWGAHGEVVSAYLPCSPCPQGEDTCHLVNRQRQECMLLLDVEMVRARALAFWNRTVALTTHA